MNKRSLVVLMLVACATAGAIQAGGFADKRAEASNALRRGDFSLAEALFREGAPKGAKYEISLQRLRDEYNKEVAARGAAAAAAPAVAPAAAITPAASVGALPEVPLIPEVSVAVPSPLRMKEFAGRGNTADLIKTSEQVAGEASQRATLVLGGGGKGTPPAKQPARKAKPMPSVAGMSPEELRNQNFLEYLYNNATTVVADEDFDTLLAQVRDIAATSARAETKAYAAELVSELEYLRRIHMQAQQQQAQGAKALYKQLADEAALAVKQKNVDQIDQNIRGRIVAAQHQVSALKKHENVNLDDIRNNLRAAFNLARENEREFFLDELQSLMNRVAAVVQKPAGGAPVVETAVPGVGPQKQTAERGVHGEVMTFERPAEAYAAELAQIKQAVDQGAAGAQERLSSAKQQILSRKNELLKLSSQEQYDGLLVLLRQANILGMQQADEITRRINEAARKLGKSQIELRDAIRAAQTPVAAQ